MLSGQCSIRVSRKVRVRLPRLKVSPSLTGVISPGFGKSSARVLAPTTDAKTFLGFTAAITCGREPEWSISEWLETMYSIFPGSTTEAILSIISSRNGAFTVSINVILSASTR